MLYLRSIFFDVFFYSFTFFYVILLLPFVIWLPSKKFFIIYQAWSHIVLTALRKIVKIKIEIEGQENIPQKPCIIACEHQSALDTIIPGIIFPQFVFVLKKELFYIPFFGFYLWKLKAIPLERKKGIASIKKLLKKAIALYQQRYHIFIFPQGTRVDPFNKNAPIQSGFYSIYKYTQMPVLPVTLDSGLYWKRKSFFKKPGTVYIKIHPVMQSGLKQNEITDQLKKIYYH